MQLYYKLVLNSCDDVTLSIANFIYEEADSGLTFQSKQPSN